MSAVRDVTRPILLEPPALRSTGPAAPRAPAAPEISGGPEASHGKSFGDVLTGALDDARALEAKANEAATAFAKGGGGIHEVMIAQEKAAIAVRYAVTLKNKALEAYRELMNTQI